MPLVKFECIDGIKIDIADCLKEGGCRLGNRCATRAYLTTVSADRKWNGKPSTTMLIAGTMLSFLRITKDYAVSPDQRAFMIHGTKSHKNLEIQDDYSLLEEKFDDDNTDISGIADVIEVENGIVSLVDYKTSGSYKVQKALGFWIDEEILDEIYKSGARKGEHKTQKVLKRDDEHKDAWEWTLQLNQYRMLLEKRGFKVDKLKIQCIVRDGGTYIARSRGVFLNLYYFDIPFMPDYEVVEYFQRKKKDLFQALKQGYWNLPCDEKENWNGLKCENYCEVAEYCKLGKYLKQEREKNIMPIKGLTEARRLPRLGKIRLGIKAKNAEGKEYPKEVDYFIADPQIPDENKKQEIIAKFYKLYGDQPKRIEIMFPVSDPDVFFQQWYKRYGSGTLLQCKGDGETAICSSEEFAKGLEITDKDDMGLPIVKCEGKNCSYFKANKCAQVGTLNVFLPEIEGLGVWQIVTGSTNSILNINSSIDIIKAACGRIHMIPLTLERRREEISHEGKKTVHYIMNISTSIKLGDLQRQALIDPSKILLELSPAHLGEDGEIYDDPRVQIPDATTEAEKPKSEPEMTFPDEQPEMATMAQRDLMTSLFRAKSMTVGQVKEFLKISYDVKGINELTKEQADQIIAKLEERANNG